MIEGWEAKSKTKRRLGIPRKSKLHRFMKGRKMSREDKKNEKGMEIAGALFGV
jgi:hypothetical protein